MNSFLKIILAALIAMPVVSGCDKAEKYLNIDTGYFDLAYDELTASASVEASASWMFNYNVDWLTATYTETGFDVAIKENNESLEERSTTITVVTGDGQTRAILVVQRAMDAYFDVSPEALGEFGSDGATTQTLTVATNITSWGYTPSESWITVEQSADGEGQPNILTVGTEQSRQLDDREGELAIAPTNEAFGSFAKTLSVVQRGANLIITSPSLSGSYVLEAPAAATEMSVSVFAKDDWTVASDDTGSRLSLSLTGGPADTENGTLLTITIPENTGTEPYNYVLTFLCGGETYEYELVQSAP